MATTSTVPKVKVTPVEGGANEGRGGFLITCSACPHYRTQRVLRIDADIEANAHLRTHGRPHPEDEEAVRV